MALHSEERNWHRGEEVPVAWDLNWRELAGNEDCCRDLVEHSQDLLCVHDLEGRFLLVNPLPARLLGYSVEEMLQKPMRDFLAPQFQEKFDVYLREIERSGEAHGLLRVVTRSGERRIWEYHNTLRTDGVPAPIVRGVAHDVTERVRAEKALRASCEHMKEAALQQQKLLHDLTLFRTLLDQSNDAIKVIDLERLRFLDVNERSYKELGYSREELLSMTVYDIDPNADQNLLDRVRRQLKETGFAIMETVHRRKDGTTFPVEVNLRRVRLDREYGVSVSRDITARKQAEERLREFERVVENLEEMVVVVNREYRYVLANRAFLSYRGMTKEQVVGSLVSQVANPAQFKVGVKEKLDECFQGKIVSFELKYQYPARGERDIALTYLPVEGPTGFDRVACILRDVTERKRAEEAVRESEARERAKAKELETVLDAVPVAVCIAHDAECRRMTGNRAACEQMGVAEGENFSLGAPLDELPGYRLMQEGLEIPVHLLPMQQAASGKPAYGRPLTIVREDGTVLETLSTAVPLLDEAGKPRGAVGASVDVTELKRAETALRESELRFRTVYQRSPLGIALNRFCDRQISASQSKILRNCWAQSGRTAAGRHTAITHPDDIGGANNTYARWLRRNGPVMRWKRDIFARMDRCAG